MAPIEYPVDRVFSRLRPTSISYPLMATTSSYKFIGENPSTTYTIRNYCSHMEEPKDTKYNRIQSYILEVERRRIAKHRLTCERNRRNRK